MKDRIDEMILQMKAQVLAFVFWIAGVLSASEIFDWSKNVILFLIAIGSGVLAIRNYYLKNKLLKKQIELKDQELGEILEAKRKKEKK